MKFIAFNIRICIVSCLIIFSCKTHHEEVGNLRHNDFCQGWRFMSQNESNFDSTQLISLDFSDENWRLVNVPHDWSIEDLPGPETQDQVGPFSKKSQGGLSTGNTLGGTGWYRKHFYTGKDWVEKMVFISFDGVQTLSDCWINGTYLGFHPNGYTSFAYDLTPYLKPAGEENIFVLRARNPEKNTRWYCGSGIYRQVELDLVSRVGIPLSGISITTPSVSLEKSIVEIAVTLQNLTTSETQVTLDIEILGPDGKTVVSGTKELDIASGNSPIAVMDLEVNKPALWSPGSPAMYTAFLKITKGNVMLDEEKLGFGIRTMEYSAEKGFLLNGEKILLKGACLHHDNGLLGAAAYGTAEERRVRIMKDNGYNAIRTSHNPPSSAFLDACDRLGMLVIDEAFDQWEKPKNPNDYHLYFNDWWQRDIESMIFRDRNHPSVVIWSIGNEIPERADSSGVRIGSELATMMRMLDGTRPVTAAICSFWDAKNKTWADSRSAFDCLDIGGYNYQWKEYENDHKLFPKRIMMGTESTPMEAYDNWKQVVNDSWVIGDFVWTGMDYLGEAGIGHAIYDSTDQFGMSWPWYISWCGDIDILGNKKPQGMYRDVLWGKSKLEILVHEPLPDGKKEKVSYWGWPNELPHWTWPGDEGKKVHVNVYSSGDRVMLFLNGKNIGEKNISSADHLTAGFDISYEPGELKAVAYKDGKELDNQSLVTAGLPFQLKLIPECSELIANSNELLYVNVEILDEKGNLVPDANLPLSLKINGPGELLAAGNACPDCLSSLNSKEFKSWRGKALIIIRPLKKEGVIHLILHSNGLKDGVIEIKVKSGLK